MDEPVNNVADFVKAAGEKTKKKAEHREEEAGCSEDALALELFDLHGAAFRYVIPWGKWFRWIKSKWEESSPVHVYAKARLLCQKKAAGCADEKVLTTLGRAKTFAAIEQILRSDERLEATIDQWDADPFLLNGPAGIVDLHTGIVGPSDPNKYCVHQTAVSPSSEIDCPLFLRFLAEITLKDEQYIEYLQ
jgi:putative DNA primase/helicase